jgi:hypothetical protein
MRSIYELVHLNPSRAAFLHLVLLGIPHRFGLLTTGWGNHYLPSELFPEPCSVFADGACNESELFTLRDSGVRFILYYELAWVVWFVMRKNTANIVAFHKILVGSSMASLLIMSWIQNYFHPSPNSPEFSPSFYTNLVFFHLLAISISLWTLAIHPKPSPGAMKWSIPANSIFCGAVRFSRRLTGYLVFHPARRCWNSDPHNCFRYQMHPGRQFFRRYCRLSNVARRRRCRKRVRDETIRDENCEALCVSRCLLHNVARNVVASHAGISYHASTSRCLLV